MPAVKAANAKKIFGADIWADLTRISPWKGLALILHGWAVIALVCAGTAIMWQWQWWAGLLATPFAIALTGGRQLGLAILMHEAAHGLTHKKRKINNFWGDWVAGAATGADLQAYRAYHLSHHRYTQQPEDPDLPLSAPFPVSKDSLRRKIIRDLTGQTFVKQRAAQFGYAVQGLRALITPFAPSFLKGLTVPAKKRTIQQQEQHEQSADIGALGSAKRDTSAGTIFNASERTETASRNGVSAPVIDQAGAIAMAKSVGRFLAVQAVLLILALLTVGAIAYGIWLAALTTSFPLFLRIRNIAEHACTQTGSGDPFSHARTTYANWLERATVAPYWVNYHAEHHLFMGIPCYNLARAHKALLQLGYAPQLTIAPDYDSVLRQVTGGKEARVAT